MNIESLRALCLSFPDVTEDIKWGADLCFLIGGKMFCVTGLDENPISISLKVKEEEWNEWIARKSIIPAPYLARYKWILIQDVSAVPVKKLEGLIRQSYELVKSKLPKSALKKPGKKK